MTPGLAALIWLALVVALFGVVVVLVVLEPKR